MGGRPLGEKDERLRAAHLEGRAGVRPPEHTCSRSSARGCGCGGHVHANSQGAPEFMSVGATAEGDGQEERRSGEPYGGVLLRKRLVLDESGRARDSYGVSQAAPRFMQTAAVRQDSHACAGDGREGEGDADAQPAIRSGLATFASQHRHQRHSLDNAAGKRTRGSVRGAGGACGTHTSLVSASAPDHMQRSLTSARGPHFERVREEMRGVLAEQGKVPRAGRGGTAVSAIDGLGSRPMAAAGEHAKAGKRPGSSKQTQASADAPAFFKPCPASMEEEASAQRAKLEQRPIPHPLAPRAQPEAIDGSTPRRNRAAVLAERRRELSGSLPLRSDAAGRLLGGGSEARSTPAKEQRVWSQHHLLIQGLPAETTEQQLSRHLRR
jgi:hypothetical protein